MISREPAFSGQFRRLHSISDLASAANYLDSLDTLDAHELTNIAGIDCAYARELIESYIDRGGDINARFDEQDCRGCALESAIYEGNERTFELLIQRGADIAVVASGFVPLPRIFYVERMAAHANITRRMLELVAVPHEHQLRYFLYKACSWGATPVVSVILESFMHRGLALSRRAVYAALRYGNRETVDLLIQPEWGGVQYLETRRGLKLRSRFYDRPDYHLHHMGHEPFNHSH